jgi:hypothetical protein
MRLRQPRYTFDRQNRSIRFSIAIRIPALCNFVALCPFPLVLFYDRDHTEHNADRSRKCNQTNDPHEQIRKVDLSRQRRI